jgi:hypothetical protein
MHNKDAYFHQSSNPSSPFSMSRAKFQTFRVVLLTSLFWVLIDAFLIFYLTDCGGNPVSGGNSLSCEYKLEHVQMQLLQLQKDHAKLIKHLPGPDPNDEVGEREREYDAELKDRNGRLHNVHAKNKKEKVHIHQQQQHGEDKAEVAGEAVVHVDRGDELTSVAAPNQPAGGGGFFGKIKDWWREDNSAEPTNPPFWPGENGRGVVIPDHLKKESERRFKENQFNIVASDLAALNRSIPDQRSET